MKLLSTHKRAGKLRESTPLEAIIRNVTRWLSCGAMIERFFCLEEFIDQEDLDLAALMPSGADKLALENARKHLKVILNLYILIIRFLMLLLRNFKIQRLLC
jgi:hypothetical protein